MSMLRDAPARLKEERQRMGLNQADFGKLGEVSKNTQLAYESGATPIPTDYLTRLGDNGVDLWYVMSGNRSVLLGDQSAEEPQGSEAGANALSPAHASDLVDVLSIDLNFGMGAAFMDTDIVEHQAERLKFPGAWLRQITPTSARHLYWTRGVGNSMEPTIGDGDVVLIDRSKVGSSFGDLYWAISYGQTGMIKRLRPMPDGSIKILSDNPNVPPEIAYDGELNVFGRVVAIVKKV